MPAISSFDEGRLSPTTAPKDDSIPPEYAEAPARVGLVANPGTPRAEAIKAFLNPPDLRVVINVEWSRLPVIGLDHEVVHYSRTRSLEIPLTFYFSAFEAAMRVAGLTSPSDSYSNTQRSNDSRTIKSASMEFVHFFESLCFPTRSGLRPPTLQVTWPHVFNLIGVVNNLSLNYHKFDRSLAPIIYQAEIVFLETRVQRRFSEDVRVHGLQHTEPAEKKGK